MKTEEEERGPISPVGVKPEADVVKAETSEEKFHMTLSQFAFASSSNYSTTSPRRSSQKSVTPSRFLDSPAYSPRKAKDGTTIWQKSGTGKRAAVDDEDASGYTLRKGSSSTKKQKQKRGFADANTYAHLRNLNDYLKEDLQIIFCGINPGVKSAEIGHHFGNLTNHFWACLHESGLSSERLRPEQDHTLPERFSIGMTNLVERPTAEQNELSKAEQIAGVPAFLQKIARYRPHVVCFVGLGIAGIVASQVFKDLKIKGKNVKNLIGLQPYKLVYPVQPDDTNPGIRETMFYAVSSTSGRVVQYQKSDKIQQFKELKNTVEDIKQSKLDTSKLHAVKPPIPVAIETAGSLLSQLDTLLPIEEQSVLKQEPP